MSLSNTIRRVFSKPPAATKKTGHHDRRLFVEDLERRDLMAGIDVDFTQSTGLIKIVGDGSANGVSVSIESKGNSNPYDDNVVVQTRDCGWVDGNSCYPSYSDPSSTSKTYSFPLYSFRGSWIPTKNVRSLFFDGKAGGDYFQNKTSLPSTALGGDGNDKLFGGSGEDFMSGHGGADFIFGNSGADVIYGGEGADKLYGGNGHDILVGGEGDDYLSGHFGHDILIGGQGADGLHGGEGDDILIGADTVFSEYDLVLKEMRDLWVGSQNYWTNVDKLRNTGVTVWGQTYKLNSASIVNDSQTDDLTGWGGYDWFWGSWAECDDKHYWEFLN